MQLRTYVFQLLGLCIFLVIILLGLCKGFSNAFGQYFDFSLIVIAIFAFINLQIYYFGTITIRNKNKYLFTNITMGMTFVKILLSIAIIVVYKSKYYPPDTNYIVPFFLIYALFTIFETYKLSKLVQTRSNV